MIEKLKSFVRSDPRIQKIKTFFSSGPRVAFSVLALIVIWMIIGSLIGGGNQATNTSTAEVKGKLNEVLVKRSHAEPIHRDISILGETQYSRHVVITALTDGTVISIPGKEGELASSKKTIINLDNREAKAEYQQAKALEQQRKMEFDGYKKLFDDKLISPARFAQAKSELESAKAQKVKKQIQLESTALKPPFDGVIQKIFVEKGDYVRVGQEMAEILDFSPFIIAGDVSEKEAVYIRQGMKANASLIDGSVFKGVISYKSSKADPKSRSFNIEMTVENNAGKNILSGVSSTINIPVTHDKAHKIASSSLEIDDAGKFGVKTIDQNNMVSFHNIEILKSSNEGVWVKGLPDEANIIIRGQGFVKVGDIVKPVFEQEQSADTKKASSPQKESKDNNGPQVNIDS